jgi:hypothetical protein
VGDEKFACSGCPLGTPSTKRACSWGDENDPLGAKTTLSAFAQALADLGWTDGRKVQMDGLQPGIILAGSIPGPPDGTRTIPIVFVDGGDTVAIGMVSRLAARVNVSGFATLA